MLQRKINALKRIKDEAEKAALDHEFDIEMGKKLKEGRYCYVDAKKFKDGDNPNDEDHNDEGCRLVLNPEEHFSWAWVNTSQSAVYVPTSVNDQEPKLDLAVFCFKLWFQSAVSSKKNGRNTITGLMR